MGAHEVRRTLSFDTLPRHCHVKVLNGEAQVIVSTRHWQCITQEAWKEDPIQEIASDVKRVERILRLCDTRNGRQSRRVAVDPFDLECFFERHEAERIENSETVFRVSC